MIDLMFAKEFFRTHRETGAIAPSSNGLGRALARYVDRSREPGRAWGGGKGLGFEAGRGILEVGPGTGTVTRHIVRALGPADTLDLIEANPRFARRMADGLSRDPVLSRAADRVRLHSGFVQDLTLGQYDAIVCGLPFANFDAETAGTIFDRLLGALAPGGTLSFFAYAGVPALRRSLTTGPSRIRTLGVQSVLDRVLTEHRFAQDFVLGNLPPARVHHLRVSTALLPAAI
ncbi:methyltransferase [Kitasatospora sp. GP82]|uniref:class I SAM-dependent methyltransferase n=1 Tax=Kitasatospora sp. GP82 TaxID=3035089 RepID=UPI002474C5F5|nr:methyltransferase [Kitasatospora sp. GP82]MDH6125247.1 phosphatidylethanolamine/phosphatidyl-N-methylethanolamine N-methyltransferase [Kitasatospora sp. GP82]